MTLGGSRVGVASKPEARVALWRLLGNCHPGPLRPLKGRLEASFSLQVSTAFLSPGPWPYAFLSQRGTRSHHDAPVPSL